MPQLQKNPSRVQILHRITPFIYFAIVVGLWLAQAALIYQARFLYRFEDAGQNATSVLWFANREIAVITSTYFGWYALLHFVYSLFGFALNAAHYVRLVLDAFSLLSLAILLKKYLGSIKSIIPLITIGLSPTFTYFFTSSAQYGLEIQLLPICLLLIDALNFAKKTQAIIFEGLLWFLVMSGLLSFAPFTFFLPGLGILYLVKLLPVVKKRLWSKVFLHAGVSVFAFLMPLVVGLLWFKNPQSLFYSQESDLGGLFRSGSALVFDLGVFKYGTSGMLRDLFASGYSYYYQLHRGEFSYIFPIISLFFVFTITGAWIIQILRSPKKAQFLQPYRWPLLVAWITILANVIIANFGVDLSGLPGVRRNTATLAAFYGLYVLCWWYATNYKWRDQYVKYGVIIILLLLPLHHLVVLPDNYRHLSDPSIFHDDKRYLLSGNAQNYYNTKLAVLTKQDLYLDCREAYNMKTEGCSYQNIFSTLSVSCLYNHLSCHTIYGYDPEGNRFIPLSVETLNTLDYLR